MIGIKMESRLL